MNIEITFEGKPFDPESFKDALMRGIIEKAIESVKARVSSVLSIDEQNQIRMNISKTEGEKITINFSGPEEIVSKITAAFQSQESRGDA
jgi:hypothetical protein